MKRRLLVVCGVVALVSACSGRGSSKEGSDETPTPTGTPTPGETPPLHPTVEEVIDDGCTTSVLRPLSEQLLLELDCLEPGSVTLIPQDAQIDVGSIFDFLQTPAGATLPDVVDDRPGVTLTINSALRSLAQQYLLYEWYQAGLCGISLAATPGMSNHESGLAIDVGDSTGWRTVLQSHTWTWLGAGDPVHYDYAGSGTVSIQGASVLAFQRLWNLNRPGDPIDEDGLYGPQTGARLAMSPVNGFGLPSTCGSFTSAIPFRFVLEESPETCGR